MEDIVSNFSKMWHKIINLENSLPKFKSEVQFLII